MSRSVRRYDVFQQPVIAETGTTQVAMQRDRIGSILLFLFVLLRELVPKFRHEFYLFSQPQGGFDFLVAQRA